MPSTPVPWMYATLHTKADLLALSAFATASDTTGHGPSRAVGEDSALSASWFDDAETVVCRTKHPKRKRTPGA